VGLALVVLGNLVAFKVFRQLPMFRTRERALR
jgi:hypothetical protein